MEPKRNMLLIDAGYIAAVSRAAFDEKLDVLKLRKFLEAKYGKFQRAFWLTSRTDERNHGFHTWLARSAKIEVVEFGRKSFWCRECAAEHEVEKGIDVGLVVKAVEHCRGYERLVLCNGDGDLREGLRYLRDVLDKEIVLVGTKDTISSESALYADEVVDLVDEAGAELYKDI